MRIAIHTLGTRGDIQPYVALALGLQAEGHDVLMVAPTQYEAFVGGFGIAFAHLPKEFLELMETPEARAAMAGGGGGFAAGFRMIRHFKPIGRRQLSMEWDAARRFQPELIIRHPKAVAAPHIAERLGCPVVLASPLPGFTPTRAFASPMAPVKSLGPLNRLSHSFMANSAETIFAKMVREFREAELGLAQRPARPLRLNATLYAYSPSVLPVPADWPEDVAVTGYWLLEAEPDWAPDPALAAFLAAGEAPVYVGFGSMPGIDSGALTPVVIEALKRAGRRGVLATGGGAINASAEPGIHVIDGAPHDRLFPLMSACVHHGGAGTTAASLRAGKPTVICPFFGDQPFWARRVHDLGAGPVPITLKALSVDRLAQAIVEATRNPTYGMVASQIGTEIQSEDGVGSAIAFLHSRGLLRPV